MSASQETGPQMEVILTTTDAASEASDESHENSPVMNIADQGVVFEEGKTLRIDARSVFPEGWSLSADVRTVIEKQEDAIFITIPDVLPNDYEYGDNIPQAVVGLGRFLVDLHQTLASSNIGPALQEEFDSLNSLLIPPRTE